jgi:capsular polysaccharide biosynthesis protein
MHPFPPGKKVIGVSGLRPVPAWQPKIAIIREKRIKMDTQLIQTTLKKRWWLFLGVFLVTVAVTLALTMSKSPVYKAKATYITKLNPEITDDKGITSALDILNRQDETVGTYSQIAMSEKIADLAADELQLTGSQKRDFTVNSRVIPGTRMLEISVLGQDPQKVRDFTMAVGDQTAKYVNSLYVTYQLELLDPADAPGSPISPKLDLNLILALVLGLFIGAGALFFSAWLTMRTKPTPAFNVEGEEVFTPVNMELGELQKQFNVLRLQMEETQRMIHATREDAQLISTQIMKLPKSDNGTM